MFSKIKRFFSSKHCKIRVLVCNTCNSEPIENLNKTLNPLNDSLKMFRGKAGIPWEDIAVCVMFDGC